MMMGTYSQKFGGQVRLDQIMEAVNTKYWDLPFLNKHVNVNGSEICACLVCLDINQDRTTRSSMKKEGTCPKILSRRRA